jgi:uroporphyrinogen-III decarboxylase
MNELYDERLARMKKAVALEAVDKIPVAPCANAYFARSQGVLLKDYVSKYELACTTNLKAFEEMGTCDATQNVIFSPWLLSGQWLAKVAVPGVELGDDDLWQIVEDRNVTQEDYEYILKHGFGDFYNRFMLERLDNNQAKLEPFFKYLPMAYKRFADAGIPCICDFLLITPFEFFCGGRSLEVFFTEDLHDQPELIDKVFAVTMEYTMKTYRTQMETLKPVGIWIGGWRAAPQMISPSLWNRFVWPYFKAYTELCIEMDVIPIFHLDSNWTSQLERFREMPAKKCILALDSKTNIRKAKAILGDMMCILGDVPAELLAFGSSEEVYRYATRLIDDIGPTGYILASGCDIPANAKKENVKAMVDAANHSSSKSGVIR